jgi:hypothetical protein
VQLIQNCFEIDPKTDPVSNKIEPPSVIIIFFLKNIKKMTSRQFGGWKFVMVVIDQFGIRMIFIDIFGSCLVRFGIGYMKERTELPWMTDLAKFYHSRESFMQSVRMI